jgi:hypothetical protein
MLNEHAITYHDRINVSDLDYLIKKANRLGKLGRDVMRVYQEEDRDGVHVYFEVEGMGREKIGMYA